MSAERPSIRAGFVQATVNAIEREDAKVYREVLDQMDREYLRVLQEASRVSWIPVEVDLDLTEQLFVAAGTLGARKIFRDTMCESFQTALLQPLFRAARHLFGPSVQRTVTWAAKPWNLVYRNCGALEATSIGDKSARLRLSRLPLSLCESRVYLQGTCGAIEGFFQAVHVSGSVHLSGPDVDTREATFLLRWD